MPIIAVILLPALLFWLAWYPMQFTQLLFVALLPWLNYAQLNKHSSFLKYYGILYLSLLGFNITTTWWVWNSSPAGAVAMLALNSLFMLLPFTAYRITVKRTNNNTQAFAALLITWLTFEYLHHRWDLSWPWLTLGNGLVGLPNFIQWYEITGTLGGSFIVIIINLLILRAINNKSNTQLLLPTIALIGLYLLSIGLKSRINPKEGTPVNVAVIQPNYDPWNEKFDTYPLAMVNQLWETTKRFTGDSTNVVLWPETSLASSINIDKINLDFQVRTLQEQLRNDSLRKNLTIISGINAVKFFQSADKPHTDARPTDDPTYWYIPYNSSIQLDTSHTYTTYHKSKLVPGTEQLPFVKYLPFLESLAISLDEHSTTGTLGISDSATTMYAPNPAAPLICYESIYGDYVRDFVKQGAQWLAVLTNDAWWENSPGYKQHYSYATLRAIEQRKWVARSANTGSCGFINPLGETVKSTTWYENRPSKQSPYQYFWGFPTTSPSQLDAKFNEIHENDTLKVDPLFPPANHQTGLNQTLYANTFQTLYLKTGDLFWLITFSMIISLFAFLKSRNSSFAN